jgi:AcrR family transcriptional regulator
LNAATRHLLDAGRLALPKPTAAAGVNPSQVYHHFGNKKGLTRAVIAYRTDSVLEDQEPLLSHLDSLRALHAWRDQAVDIQARRQCHGGCPIGTLGSELADTDEDARADVAAAFERWQNAIREGLRDMYARGDLQPQADPDELATALLCSLQGGLLLSKVARSTRPLEVALDTTIAHIRSLLKQPDQPRS